MAKEFNAKEARQLIERHKELLSDLEHIFSVSSAAISDIRRSAVDLISNKIFEQIIVKDCENPIEFNIKTNTYVEKLICSLYKYEKMLPITEKAIELQGSTSSKVKQNIALLNPGVSGLTWLFSGKSVKLKAVQAYHDLSNILNENYALLIPDFKSKIDEITYLSADEAWNAYEATPNAFIEILKKTVPTSYEQDQTKTVFKTQLSKKEDLEKNIAQSEKNVDADRDAIKSAAEHLLAYNALKALNEVSVDEINRVKSGFRVKALKDAGFMTMADIYSASVYQLTSLNGISETAAFYIKHTAKQLLDDVQKDIKIKLSADDRNKETTKLATAIYIYRNKKVALEELKEFVRSNKDSLTDAEKALKAVGNGFPWLFFSPEQKSKLRIAYDKISSAINGAYAKNVIRLTGIILNKKPNPTENMVWEDFKAHNIEYISVLEEIVPDALGNNDALYGLPEELAREIQGEALYPDGLLCTLRHYQEWGVKYILHQKRVLLGDEMGLGKTVQAIATMVSLRNTGATHFMVVCPASVVTNWCREIVKHSKLRVTKIHGSGRDQAFKSWVKSGDVAVTTFETTAYIEDDKLCPVDLIIVDEAHYIKNPEARRSINVKRLCAKSECILFMTGTALENNVEEMITLIDVLQPDIAARVKDKTFITNAPWFRNQVAPVYYRRKRENVLTELPELIETQEWCTLNSEEKEQYERDILSGNYTAARRLSWNAADLKKSCKANRLFEIIEDAKNEDRKVLVFSFFLNTINVIGYLLGERCYGPINGKVPVAQRQEIIDSFDKAPAGSVLLAQIQSGGTGLNIQSASVVVICEPQFKPSIENQAVSRAYRMGQARNVLVYRLLCTNTIDEKITELLNSKQQIFDAFADKSVAAEQNEANNNEIDEKKFGQLIQEEIDRINREKEKSE